MIRQNKIDKALISKAISRQSAVLSGMLLFLVAGVLFAGCDDGSDQSKDASMGSLDDSLPEGSNDTPDGIPPIDQATYDNTEVATFGLG